MTHQVLTFIISLSTEPFLLIMEYVMYGRLLTFLRDHRTHQTYYNYSSDSEALTSRDLTTFAYCVAKGMEYIYSKGVLIEFNRVLWSGTSLILS